MSPMPDRGFANLQQTIDDLRRQLAERTVERDEALARETATAEVLIVINSSAGNLSPVWDAMLEKATRLCEAAAGILWIYDGARFRAIAQLGLPNKLVAELQTNPIPTASLQKIADGANVVRDDDLSKNRGAERVVAERLCAQDREGAEAVAQTAMKFLFLLGLLFGVLFLLFASVLVGVFVVVGAIMIFDGSYGLITG